MIFSHSKSPMLCSFNFLAIIIAASVLLASCSEDSPVTPLPQTDVKNTLTIPAGLTAIVNSISAITLSWNNVSNASDYEIYRHSNNNSSNSTRIAKLLNSSNNIKVANPLSGEGNSYQNTGLTPNTQYYYWLKSCNMDLCSGFSNDVSASTQADTPTPPTGLTATVKSISTISLSWTGISNATDYEIYRHSSDDSSNSTRISNPLSSLGNSYQNIGLTADTQYYYWLKACNNGSCSDFSNGVSASTQADTPTPPTGLTATVNSTSTITLSWNNVSNASDYEIYRHSSDDSSNSTRISNPLSSLGNSYQNIGLTADTQYYYWLKACNNGSCSDFSNGVSAGTQPLPTNPLNDTGITFGGNYASGNNIDCTSDIIAEQDCHQGRDATHNDDSDGYAGFSFTKISSTGAELTASANSWACVRDNVTGLMWEVKTSSGVSDSDTTDDTHTNIHHKDNVYRWGGIGADSYGPIRHNDWNSLVDGSNNNTLCGFSNWRVPNRQELNSIVDYSRISPTIDSAYFPNTVALYFGSSSAYASNSSNAWSVYFGAGNDYPISRGSAYRLRLVKGG